MPCCMYYYFGCCVSKDKTTEVYRKHDIRAMLLACGVQSKSWLSRSLDNYDRTGNMNKALGYV